MVLSCHVRDCASSSDGAQQLNNSVQVISVLVIIVMLQKGHCNLLTSLNEVPATFDINYVRPVSMLSRRRRRFIPADYVPLLPCRDQISMLPPDVGAFGLEPLVLLHHLLLAECVV